MVFEPPSQAPSRSGRQRPISEVRGWNQLRPLKARWASAPQAAAILRLPAGGNSWKSATSQSMPRIRAAKWSRRSQFVCS